MLKKVLKIIFHTSHSFYLYVSILNFQLDTAQQFHYDTALYICIWKSLACSLWWQQAAVYICYLYDLNEKSCISEQMKTLSKRGII